MSDMSSNNFSKDVPTESANTFSDADKGLSGNAFAKDRPAESGNLPSGDNTTGDVYGTDEVLGVIYGDNNYGGLNHFKNRTNPPSISHG